MEKKEYLRIELTSEDGYDTDEVWMDLGTIKVDVSENKIMFDFFGLPPTTSKENPRRHAIIDVSKIQINEELSIPPD